MATIKEYIRDFERLKKWEKIGIIIGVLGLFGGLTLIFNPNIIMVNNSSFVKSPIIQSSSNVTINYGDTINSDICESSYYPRLIYVYNIESTAFEGILSRPADIFSVKVILPDGQAAFLESFKYGSAFIVARCNEASTDCCVMKKFRMDKGLDYTNPCWVIETRFYAGKENDTVSQKIGDNKCFNFV